MQGSQRNAGKRWSRADDRYIAYWVHDFGKPTDELEAKCGRPAGSVKARLRRLARKEQELHEAE